MPIDYTQIVPAPKASDVNTGVEPCPTQLIIQRRGMPRRELSSTCMPATSPYWSKRMVTKDVGPFRATGFEPFLDFLASRFALVKRAKPDLYAVLGSAGVLCIRHVRGRPGVLSNHGFGMAWDGKISGIIDPRGDGLVQVGMLELWKIIKCPELYWGVEFRVEDGMHIEASRKLVMDWIQEGLL